HGPLEERLRRAGVPPLREVGVDHLPVLVDGAGAVRVPPAEGAVRLVHAPLRAHPPQVLPGRGAKQREEALHPAVDAAPLPLTPPSGEPFGNIRIAQPEAGVPPDGQGDHVVGKAPAREGAGRPGGEPPPARVTAPALPTEAGLPVPPRRPVA